MYTKHTNLFQEASKVLTIEAQAINKYVMDNHEQMTHDEKLNCHQRILNITHLMWSIEDQANLALKGVATAEEYTRFLCDLDCVNDDLFNCCHNTAKYI